MSETPDSRSDRLPSTNVTVSLEKKVPQSILDWDHHSRASVRFPSIQPYPWLDGQILSQFNYCLRNTTLEDAKFNKEPTLTVPIILPKIINLESVSIILRLKGRYCSSFLKKEICLPYFFVAITIITINSSIVISHNISAEPRKSKPVRLI